MPEAVIIDCLRTAVGKAPRGALRNNRPDDLGAIVIRALLDRYPAAASAVEDVILGCAMPEGEAGGNMARQSALISSIKTKLLPLGDEIGFICGHGPGGRFGEERRTNPFLI